MAKPAPAPLPCPETVRPADIADRLRRGDTDLVVVLGPTASGKTRYAVQLARSLGLPAEIISADSRQVYRGMDIGTGKDLGEYGAVPFHLIDICEAGEQYNLYRYKQDFKAAYADIRARGAVPILCGGTGLYIHAVTSGYDFSEGKPLSAPSAGTRLPEEGMPQKPYFIGTIVSREERNARIDRRLDERLHEGMVEEVRGLLERGVPAETLLSYGLEYKFVTLYLRGELSYAEMRDRLATAIHQFAKRQMTWFRGMERSGVQIHWTHLP